MIGFANFEDNSTTNQSITVTDEAVSNVSVLTDGADDDEGLLFELGKLMSGDFDVVRFGKKVLRKVFGRHAWLDALIELDFATHFETAQAWGFDLALFNRLFAYTKTSALHFTSQVLSIIGLLLSFGSWVVSLGLDFLVFSASLFYLVTYRSLPAICLKHDVCDHRIAHRTVSRIR